MATVDTGPVKVPGPSAALIGWIPYRPLLGGRLPLNFTRHRYARALRLVLCTGNRPEPPPRLSGRPDYDRFIESRNFRATLCLFDVVLTCYPDGRDAEIRATAGDYTGYTPLTTGGRFGPFTYDLAWHDKGVGEVHGQVDRHPEHATIRRLVTFRIAKVGNLGARLLTGHWAPFAWMSIAYTLRRDGSVRVDYRGSLIPSQSMYAGWRRRRRYSMLTLTPSQISGFIQAGGDALAPGTLHHTWTSP